MEKTIGSLRFYSFYRICGDKVQSNSDDYEHLAVGQLISDR